MDFNMKEYFDSLASGMEKKLAAQKTAKRIFIYELGRIGQKLFDPKYASAWTGVFVPFEIFQAMDVGAVYIEFVGAMLSSAGMAPYFLQKGEENGITPDGCAYHRALYGAASEGLLGKPQLLIGATTPCDGGLKTILNMSRLAGVEPFVLDIPYPPITREKINYLTGQYKDMTDYIERQSGKKFDPERLREAAIQSNAAVGIVRKIYEACKCVPAPVTSETLKNFQIVFALLMGSPSGSEVAQLFLDEINANIENDCRDLPREDFRLLWVQNRIQYKNGLIDYLQNNFNAKIVVDELNYIYWDDLDEDNPLEGLAVRQIMHPLNGTAEHRIETLKLLAREYIIDGAINPSHWGCRQNCGIRQLMKSALAEVGVPMINLDVDCVDTRNYFEGQLMTRLQGFMEMLSV
jgi:benzoyl-CoA reductase/2-hydroxyglutaryl-CoA dehydratase subunit BcrC/BadD/HgdB